MSNMPNRVRLDPDYNGHDEAIATLAKLRAHLDGVAHA